MIVPRDDFGFVTDETRLFAISGGYGCIFSFLILFIFFNPLRSPINNVEVFDGSMAVRASDAQWIMGDATSNSGAVSAAIF